MRFQLVTLSCVCLFAVLAFAEEEPLSLQELLAQVEDSDLTADDQLYNEIMKEVLQDGFNMLEDEPWDAKTIDMSKRTEFSSAKVAFFTARDNFRFACMPFMRARSIFRKAKSNHERDQIKYSEDPLELANGAKTFSKAKSTYNTAKAVFNKHKEIYRTVENAFTTAKKIFLHNTDFISNDQISL